MLWWLGPIGELGRRAAESVDSLVRRRAGLYAAGLGSGSLVATGSMFRPRPSWPEVFRSDAPNGSSPRFRGANRWLREWGVAKDNRADPGDAPGASFSTLFAQHEADVLRVCRRMLAAGDAAEDAASEVYLRARRTFATYDRSRPFRPWLLGVAGNLCIDQLRRRQTESRLFDASDLSDEDLAHPGPSPLRQVLRTEQRAEIANALDTLEEKYRVPLMLRYFSDLDYQDISEVLGVSRNQVGTLLLRAKRKLRSALAKGEAS
jgi:RNA polymerase sigma factor (sigma-70 family)